MMPPGPSSSPEGDAALARGAWAEARDAFAATSRDGESGNVLEGLGLAAWWLDLADVVFDSRERAYRLFLGADRRRDAARIAVWLAWDYWGRFAARAPLRTAGCSARVGCSSTRASVRSARGSRAARARSHCSRTAIRTARSSTRPRASAPRKPRAASISRCSVARSAASRSSPPAPWPRACGRSMK